MSAHITVIGTVATEPRMFHFDNGGVKCAFRVAESERRLDRQSGQWVEGATNWYTVNVTRQMAQHAADSFCKGDRVIVTGRLRVRDWSSAEGKSGTSAEIDAEGVGHELRFGTSSYTRAEYPSKPQVTESQAGWHTPEQTPAAEQITELLAAPAQTAAADETGAFRAVESSATTAPRKQAKRTRAVAA